MGSTETGEGVLRPVHSGRGVTFWERAEALVTAALEDFAAFASDGRAFQRKLLRR